MDHELVQYKQMTSPGRVSKNEDISEILIQNVLNPWADGINEDSHSEPSHCNNNNNDDKKRQAIRRKCLDISPCTWPALGQALNSGSAGVLICEMSDSLPRFCHRDQVE